MSIKKMNTSFQQFLVVLWAVRTPREHLRFPASLPWREKLGKEVDNVTQPFFENKAILTCFKFKPFKEPKFYISTICKSKVTVRTWSEVWHGSTQLIQKLQR